MLDSGDVVYLWHGWWPEETSDSKNVTTGSAQAKFNIDRQCAMQTALQYCKCRFYLNKYFRKISTSVLGFFKILGFHGKDYFSPLKFAIQT